jgi:metal-responsive CopG/Arc/MetJ family transcriptional regulator
MKTAISLPDHLFDEAEETARKLGLSRSELYARAVEAFLEAHRQEGVTAQLNQVYGDQESSLDPALSRMQQVSLQAEDWD